MSENYIVKTENENYLHLIFSTSFFKFKDDVELYFDENTKKIHYRSESRLGYSDFGKNKARYEELKKLYDQTN